ncbi:MAG TPA: ABC transporter substrate-binding protein [Beijerinckia sp.]|jgi:iron complex transport system substrate-binding protein|nr:ABC transporter substrate-binding protein [Beijerinckia sp.]
MRHLVAALLIAAALLGAPSAGAREITDMTGRHVTIPDKITKIYSASYPLTLLFYAFAPDLLVAANFPLGEEQKPFVPPQVANLPAIGAAMGQGRGMNPEEVLALHPDLIVAWVDPFGDTSHTTQQFDKTGLPIVFIRMNTLADYPAALQFLGELFDRPQRAAILGDYISNAIAKVTGTVATIPPEARVNFYYAESRDGLATECDKSFHVEAIAVAGGENVEHCSQTTHFGMEKVTLEEIIAAQPAIILSQDHRFADTVSLTPQWRNVEAVRTGHIVNIPQLPFNWLDRPPSFMRALGIQWLANLFYPDLFPMDVKAETRNFHHLFFGVELSDQDVDRILH